MTPSFWLASSVTWESEQENMAIILLRMKCGSKEGVAGPVILLHPAIHLCEDWLNYHILNPHITVFLIHFFKQFLQIL